MYAHLPYRRARVGLCAATGSIVEAVIGRIVDTTRGLGVVPIHSIWALTAILLLQKKLKFTTIEDSSVLYIRSLIQSYEEFVFVDNSK